MNLSKCLKNKVNYLFILRKFLIIFLLIVSIYSCANQKKIQFRLHQFYELLTPEQINFFKNGELTKVEEFLKVKVKESKQDSPFYKKFEEVKTNEKITLFKEKEMIDYFYQYFYIAIEKNK